MSKQNKTDQKREANRRYHLKKQKAEEARKELQIDPQDEKDKGMVNPPLARKNVSIPQIELFKPLFLKIDLLHEFARTFEDKRPSKSLIYAYLMFIGEECLQAAQAMIPYAPPSLEEFYKYRVKCANNKQGRFAAPEREDKIYYKNLFKSRREQPGSIKRKDKMLWNTLIYKDPEKAIQTIMATAGKLKIWDIAIFPGLWNGLTFDTKKLSTKALGFVYNPQKALPHVVIEQLESYINSNGKKVKYTPLEYEKELKERFPRFLEGINK